MNLELIIEEIKNALGWSVEQVAAHYPMLLREYQMYCIFRELNYTFGFLWFCSGVGVLVLFFFTHPQLNKEEKNKLLKIQKKLLILFFVSVALSSLFSILQIILSPNIKLIIDILSSK